jgi:hypothetical protein
MPTIVYQAINYVFLAAGLWLATVVRRARQPVGLKTTDRVAIA